MHGQARLDVCGGVAPLEGVAAELALDLGAEGHAHVEQAVAHAGAGKDGGGAVDVQPLDGLSLGVLNFIQQHAKVFPLLPFHGFSRSQ